MKKIMSAAALMVALTLPTVALAGADAPKTMPEAKAAIGQTAPATDAKAKGKEIAPVADTKAKEVVKKVDKAVKTDKAVKGDKLDQAKDKAVEKAPVAPVTPTAPAK